MTEKAAAVCKEITKLLEQAGGGKFGIRETLDDFCTVAMASHYNALYSIGKKPVPEHYRANHDKLESDFDKTLAKYKNTNAHDTFANLLAKLVLAMWEEPVDYLGKIYMDSSLGNKGLSQFFTPSHVCELMAQMTIPNKEDFELQVSNRGYVGMADPCCGSGALSIGMIKVLRHTYGVQNLNTKLFLQLTDIDYRCVKMAFVNMSILGIAARVVCGDTLSGREDRVFDTPDLQIALARGCFRNTDTRAEPIKSKEEKIYTQLSLF